MQIDPERIGEKGIEDNIRSHKLNPYYREASYVTFPATLSNHQVCSQSKGEKKRTVKPFSRHYTEQNSTHSSKDSWLTAAASLPPHSNVSIDAAAAAAPAVVVDEEERVAERAPVKLSSRIPWPSHRDEDVRGRRGRKTTLEPASQPLLRGKQGVSGADFSLHFRVQPQPRGFRVLSAFPSTAPPSLFPGRRRRASFFHD